MNLFMDHMESILNEGRLTDDTKLEVGDILTDLDRDNDTGRVIAIRDNGAVTVKWDDKDFRQVIIPAILKKMNLLVKKPSAFEKQKPDLTEKYERLTDAIKGEFSDLANQLSPENLACDGECSAAEANRRKKEILAQWKKLEQRIGMKVTEDMVYGWDDSVSKKGMNEEAITPAKAKKIIIDKLNELHLPYDKVTAKTIDFTDLARASMIFVKIHGWKPNPLMGELEKVAKENGFRVDA
jgi:hypothetical protein